jgi:hypothetical protein
MTGAVHTLIPVPRAPRRRTTAMLLLVVAMAATACGRSGGDEQASAALPAGFTTYQAPLFSIAYPDGWTVSEKPNYTDGPPIVVIQGPNGSGGFAPQIAVGHDTGYGSDFDDAMEVFRIVSIGQTGTVISDQPITLVGAARAQRTEYTEPLHGTDGRQYPIRIVEVHAMTPARTMYDVLVRAPQQDFDAARLTNALDSFQVRSS